jgi:hypothetical protein
MVADDRDGVSVRKSRSPVGGRETGGHERAEPARLATRAGSCRMQTCWPVPDAGYVAGRAWERAVLEECRLHPGAGCTVVRHGTYARVSPPGMQVPRFRCATRGGTISLLPGFLASHVTGRSKPSRTPPLSPRDPDPGRRRGGAQRPAEADDAVTLPAALRWLLRRVAWVREAFTTLTTLLPALHGTAPTVAAMRSAARDHVRAADASRDGQ